MKRLIIPFLFLVFWCYTECVDECGDRCHTGEVCLDNGTCVDRSELVSCGLFRYCEKGQDCCSLGCIPAGTVCCNSVFYCKAGQECCGLFYCCNPGSYCYNKSCVIGERPTTSTISTTVTTRKVQTTSKPFTTKRDSFTTRYLKTTWRPQTVTTERFVTFAPRTTSSSLLYSSSKKSSFLWWHGLIIVLVVIKVVLIVSIFLRRYFASKSNAQASGGKVLSLGQPKVVYDKYGMASNPGMPQYYPQTGNLGTGTTTATGVTVNPNMQQHLMVTKEGVPPYIIKQKSPVVVDKNAQIKGNATAVPVNNIHQIAIHTAARPQILPHPYAKSTKEKTKKEASLKYLPHL